MGAKKNNSIFGKLVTYLLVGIIVFGSIWASIYFNNMEEKPKNEDDSVESNTESIEPSPLPEITEIAVTQEVDLRSVQIFVDKNRNNIKDSNEELCDVCIAKNIVGAQVSYSEGYPGVDSLKEITIEGGGKIDENKFVGINKVWGFFSDREMLIPDYTIALGDGSSDVYVPGWPIEVNTAGVNANLVSISEVEKQDNGGYTVSYNFQALIPALSSAYNNRDEVWVYFTPKSNKLGLSYLTKGLIKKDADGTVTGSNSGFYLRVVWPFKDAQKNALKEENIKFILL